jgi:hypothetical protein
MQCSHSNVKGKCLSRQLEHSHYILVSVINQRFICAFLTAQLMRCSNKSFCLAHDVNDKNYFLYSVEYV